MKKSKISVFLRKYLWFLIALVFLIVTFFSYGFIRNLYFFREDYEDAYNILWGENHPWPNQGIKYNLYPFNLLFQDKASHYYIVGLILYGLVALIFAFFVWKLTKSRLAAFLSGLFFSSGYVGSEAMFWIQIVITLNFYLILVFSLLIFYINYLKSRLLKYWLAAFTLYLLCLLLITQRAHYLFFIILFLDGYLLFISSGKKTSSLLNNAFNMAKRLSLFAISYYMVYFVRGGAATTARLRKPEIHTAIAHLSLLSDLGNYLVPSVFQEIIVNAFASYDYIIKVALPTLVLFILLVLLFFSLRTLFTKRLKLIYLYPVSFFLIAFILAFFLDISFELFLNSLIGVFLVYILFAFIFLIRLKKNYQKTIFFLVLCWFVSYFIYHLREPQWVHPSWSRYLMSAFPFFVAIIIFIIVKVFLSSKTSRSKMLGWGILTVILLSNIIAGNISPFRKKFSERGFYVKKFVYFLKKEVPALSRMNLFYFDVVSHGPTQSLFDTFLAGGNAPPEVPLAILYKAKDNQVKIARDYNELISESRSGIYKNVYVFFYDIDKNIHNLSSYFLPDNKPVQLNITDFFKTKLRLYYGIPDGNKITTQRNKILYESIVIPTKSGSKSANDILELDLENFNFPSYKPVQLDIKLKVEKLTSTIHAYPYSDGSVLEFSRGYLDIQDADLRHSFLNYISERERFREIAQVRSEGDEYPHDIKNIIDGNLETSWFSAKKYGLPKWLEISLPDRYSFSEVRWISSYKSRLPVTYDYQISDKKEGPWKTISSIKKRKVMANEYVVDKISPVTAKYFRMVIYESNEDYPSVAISEIELIKSSGVNSSQADFFMEHPLTKVSNQTEMKEIISTIQNYQKLKVYPITDKFLHKNQSPAIKSNIIFDGREHDYSFILPAGGTKMKSILIEFSNIPLSAEINLITLKQIP